MPRIEDLLRSVRALGLPSKGKTTSRQLGAVAQLGLGQPPADMTFAEASALLTARSAARDVLKELIHKGRNSFEKRSRLEPYLIAFITSEPRVLRELIERNEQRWGFCKEGVPAPSPETRTRLFSEARRLIAEMPPAPHDVSRIKRGASPSPWKETTKTWTASKKRNRRFYGKAQRRHGPWGYFWKSVIWYFTRRVASVLAAMVTVLTVAAVVHFRTDWISSGQFASDLTALGRASVIDGDTIEVHGQRIRLWGIDAPEGRQRCFTNGKPWRCGTDAANAVAGFIGARTVTCTQRDRDRYGRVVAVCDVGGQDVGAWLVHNGWALDYARYSGGAYSREEDEAERERRGIWQGEFEPPWEWRRH